MPLERPRAARASHRPPRDCGRRPAGRARRRARGARRKPPLLVAAARSDGSCRDPSRRQRRHVDARAARELVEAACLGRRRLMGIDPERRDDPGCRSASASAVRHDSMPVPMVTIRSTPASTRACNELVRRSSHASRCACESVTPRRPVRRSAGTAVPRPRSLGRAAVRPYAPDPTPVSVGCPSAARIRGARLGDIGRERDRDDAQAVGEVVERAVELDRVRLVLGELPGRRAPRRTGSGARTTSQIRSSAPDRS